MRFGLEPQVSLEIETKTPSLQRVFFRVRREGVGEMLLFSLRRIVMVTTVTLGMLAAAPLWAEHRGHGHKGHGHRGHAHKGHGHHGHGHHGHGHHGYAHRGHGYHGGGHGYHARGYRGGGYYGGGHYGRGFYGGDLYFGRGFSLSIGAGYPYGYGGFGYGSLGYRGLDYGLDYNRYPASSYLWTYRGFSPDYSAAGRSGYSLGPVTSRLPGEIDGSPYRYERESWYGVPGYHSEFQHQAGHSRAEVVSPYSAVGVDPASADLRPGMVLSDGSTVVSVDPPGVSPAEETIQRDSGEPTPAGSQPEPTPASELDVDIEAIPTPAESPAES